MLVLNGVATTFGGVVLSWEPVTVSVSEHICPPPQNVPYSMFTLEEFVAQFGSYKVPPRLIELFNVQENVGPELLGGFCLDTYGRDELYQRLGNHGVADQFIEFAEALDDGASYGFWCVQEDLSQCPIVVFSDNVVTAVACDLEELLGLLSYDGELVVDNGKATYVKDEDYEPSEHHATYLEFYGLVPWSKAQTEATVAKAQTSYQTNLSEFVGAA